VSVVIDISMSLDGYVTAPGVDAEHGLGVDGEVLHLWAFSDDEVEQELLSRSTTRTGAVVMGRNLFDIVDHPNGWSEEVGYGAGIAAEPPCFVVTHTHTQPEPIRLVNRFTIVTDGIESALDQARAAAGDKDVVVMGGGDVCGQVLAAGLADVLSVHVAPVVFGGGTPLFANGPRFDLELTDSVATPNATHLTYRVA
jgi:dihydrofolate reductase